MGRGTTVTLSGQAGQKLTIITAYAVQQNSGTKLGPKTFWQQQWRMLKQHQTNPEPKKTFYNDLNSLIKEEKKKHQIILMLDANSNLDQNSILSKMVRKTTLIDTHTTMHSGQTPSTYKRGRKKIDFIFVTPGLIPFITKCGILPFDQSDHRMIYIDVDLRGYLKNKEPTYKTA
jgi:exonuclease III